jgi:hypothetical protein
MLNNKALAASVSAPPAVYVEDVFSTWLYTGNDSTQTITNGIDLSGKGGLTWIKNRVTARSHWLFDTARGATNALNTDTTNAQVSRTNALTAFNSNGFTLNSDIQVNASPDTYASWTFRKQAKFFDVVTYTGNGTAGRTIVHNLGSAPGFIMVKRLDTTSNWLAYHRSRGGVNVLFPNLTDAELTTSSVWNNTDPTASVFTVGNENQVNASGGTYVAYLFAHNAGGFGTAGTDSVISCGSYTGNGSTSGPTVTLGWEPQWLMIKKTTSLGGWFVFDNMRGMVSGGNDAYLRAESNNTEFTSADDVTPLATGFALSSTGGGTNDSGQNYIYIAIRRGPMKTPTSATSVFAADAYSGTGTAMTRTTGFVVDQVIGKRKDANATIHLWDRIRGGSQYLQSASTAAESTFDFLGLDSNVGYTWKTNDGFATGNGLNYINYSFRRAPGFFDVVAYTGTGSTQAISHNLAVVPELLIIKGRNQSTNWKTFYSFTSTTYKDINLNNTSVASNGTYGPGGFPNFESFTTAPTSTAFSVSAGSIVVNNSGTNYIAYLFATLTGISKVGSYTGTGTTLNIDCGFTAGARFVLIKRSDSAGDWYVYDTARGIVSGNDPFLLINSTAAEDTSTDYIDPLSSGFQISSTAPAAINANGGTYIYLSIA